MSRFLIFAVAIGNVSFIGPTGYHSKPIRPNEASPGSSYVRRTLYHSSVPLNSLSSNVTQYIPVAPRVQDVDVTDLSIYDRLVVRYASRELIQ